MKTNPALKETIRKLEEKGRKEGISIWSDLAERMKKSDRKRKPVNVGKINRHCEDSETVAVPGKVTGYGKLDKEVEVAAFSFSEDAKKKINEGGKSMTIQELMEENPEGNGVKIMEG